MKIDIQIRNMFGLINMKVDTKKGLCEIDKQNCKVSVDSVALRLYAYTHKWPRYLKNEGFVDGEKYRVLVETETEKKKFVGENSFPFNYNEFKEYILDIKTNNCVEE